MDGQWIKLLNSKELVLLESIKNVSMRSSKLKRKLYRLAYHRKNRLRENEKNTERYHKKYKTQPGFREKQKLNWKVYVSKKGNLWVRLRSRKYQKPYALLSEKQRKAIREAYKKWAKQNWGERVKYAREYRKRNPAFGLRSAIASARRSGDIGELASICEHAIAKLNEDGRKRRSKPKHG